MLYWVIKSFFVNYSVCDAAVIISRGKSGFPKVGAGSGMMLPALLLVVVHRLHASLSFISALMKWPIPPAANRLVSYLLPPTTRCTESTFSAPFLSFLPSVLFFYFETGKWVCLVSQCRMTGDSIERVGRAFVTEALPRLGHVRS